MSDHNLPPPRDGARARRVCVLATAALMLLLVLVPAGVWHSSRVDVSASGFDRNTTYVDSTGTGKVSGTVEMSPSQLRLAATPGSAPVADLTTGPLGTDSRFAVTITSATPGSQPFAVDIAAPYTDYHYKVVFTSRPTQRILVQRVHHGVVQEEHSLGLYQLNQRYDMQVLLDRKKSTATIRMDTPEGQVKAGQALLLTTTDKRFDSHVIAAPVRVTPGTAYELSAAVKALLPGVEGLSVEWLDRRGRRLGLHADWADSLATKSAGAWEGRLVDATAPPGTAAARVEVATADGAQALFSQVQLTKAGDSVNLLSNGDFVDGAKGWRRETGSEPLETQPFAKQSFTATISARQWPQLFDSLRMSISVRSSSTYGLGAAELTDYRLDVFHQRWLAVKISDWRPRLLSILLVLATLALCWPAISRFIVQLRHKIAALTSRRVITISPNAILAALAFISVFVVGNVLLSRIGSLNADVVGARVWVYTAAQHGPAALYTWPNVSSAEAAQWRGLPLQEAGFPYGPVMAYIFGALGLVYRFALHQPVTGPSDLSQIDILVKATIGLFALADAAIAYLILRTRGIGTVRSRLVMIALVLNPAIWFAGSVWGTTQTISLPFLLLAIYFFDRRSLTACWVFVIAAVLTRPQNIFVVAILVLVMLRVTNLNALLRSFALAVMATFTYLLPFALLLSPTLPADILANALFLHVGNGNDAWTMPLSFGGMSIWPLVSQITAHVHGADRILYLATHPLTGSVSYYQAGSALLAVFLLVSAALVFWRGKRLVAAGRLPIILAATSLGTFLLNTATPSYHLVLALVLIALTRSALSRRVYWACLGGITLTTFLSMYAMGAYWLAGHPVWGVGIYDPHSPITRLMRTLPTSDWFVTTLCLINLAIFITLIYAAYRPVRPDVNTPRHAAPIRANAALGTTHHGVPVIEMSSQ